MIVEERSDGWVHLSCDQCDDPIAAKEDARDGRVFLATYRAVHDGDHERIE